MPEQQASCRVTWYVYAPSSHQLAAAPTARRIQ